MSGRRRVGTVALGLVAALVAAVPWLARWGELPATVATHFSWSGTADGSLPRALAALVSAGPALAGAAALVVLGARPRTRTTAGWAGLVAGLAALFAVLSAAVVSVNAGLDDWHEAELAGWSVPLALAALVGAMALATWLVRGDARPDDEGSTPGTGGRPVVALADGEVAAWAGRATSRWALPLATLGVLGAVGTWLSGAPAWAALPLLLVAAACAPFGSVRVTAGRAGVRVVAGPGWPHVEVPLDRIASAEAIDLRPSAWGGWGYRGSRKLFGKAAWVLRGGEALRLDLVDGTVFAVTVDGAAGAAALLEGLRSRA